jgi:hypothetical protein
MGVPKDLGQLGYLDNSSKDLIVRIILGHSAY